MEHGKNDKIMTSDGYMAKGKKAMPMKEEAMPKTRSEMEAMMKGMMAEMMPKMMKEMMGK